MWSNETFGAVCASTTCPGDQAPEEESDPRCRDAVYIFSGKSIELDVPAPLDTDADSFERRVGLLNEEYDRGALALVDSPSRSEAFFLHKLRDQSSGRLAAPIRGPAA